MRRTLILLMLTLLACGHPGIPYDPLALSPCAPEEAQALLEDLRQALVLDKPLTSISKKADGGWSIMVLHLSSGSDRPTRLQVVESSKEAALGRLLERVKLEKRSFRWMRLDVVQGATPASQERTVERGLSGFMSDTSAPKLWLPLEVPVQVLSAGGGLHFDKLGRLDPDAKGWFQVGFASAMSDGARCYPLFRDHAIERPSRKPQEILAAATACGDYLLRCLEPGGRFKYSYLPVKGEFPDGYNMLRHAGSICALLQLYKATNEPRFLAGAAKALHYMSFSIVASKDDPQTKVLLDSESVKLGGNALALLAFCEYYEATGDRRSLAHMADLAAWIVKNQDSNGRFVVHKQSFPEARDSGFESAYYPGEAVLSLVRLYQIDGDERWLEAARRAAHYLIAKGQKEAKPAHDHWLMIGLRALYQEDHNPAYPAFVWKLARAILADQHGDNHTPDWSGGFYDPPRSTPTDIRVEGLNAAWALAGDAGKEELSRQIGTGVARALEFSRLCEVDPAVAILLSEPAFCHGGVMKGLSDPEIRIDYVQHHISALLGFYQNAQRKAASG